jgi:alkylation response protein AidB-like acyl-CoA dehydrogenase
VRLSDSRAEARFRAELAAWLDENGPAPDRATDPPRSPGHIPAWARIWQRTLFEAGWLVPRWPPELGGRDASAVEQLIYLEELSTRRLSRTTNPLGLDVCAPALADHGDELQREEWLPRTLRGEMSWCLAVTDLAPEDGAGGEPPAPGGAGDDVVAEERDGVLRLRGTLPAPAGAEDADRCLCVVRRETDAEADDGAPTAVAVDLAAPGVTRPTPAAPVLVLDDVAVGEHDVVGGLDGGWPVVRGVRARLRSLRWITGLLAVGRAVEALAEVGQVRGLADDGVFRDTLAGLRVEADAVRALAYRALAKQDAGRPNPELTMLPLAVARARERVYHAGLEALGADGLDMGLEGPEGWPGGSWASEWTAALAEQAAAGGLAAERERVAGRLLGRHLR